MRAEPSLPVVWHANVNASAGVAETLRSCRTRRRGLSCWITMRRRCSERDEGIKDGGRRPTFSILLSSSASSHSLHPALQSPHHRSAPHTPFSPPPVLTRPVLFSTLGNTRYVTPSYVNVYLLTHRLSRLLIHTFTTDFNTNYHNYGSQSSPCVRVLTASPRLQQYWDLQ